MDAFKSAVVSEQTAKNKTTNQVVSGIKDIGVAIAGGLAGPIGTGVGNAFGSATIGNITTKALTHGLANKVGGIGGSIMVANLQQGEQNQKQNKLMEEQLRSADEQLAKTQELIDRPGAEALKQKLDADKFSSFAESEISEYESDALRDANSDEKKAEVAWQVHQLRQSLGALTPSDMIKIDNAIREINKQEDIQNILEFLQGKGERY